MPLLLPLLPPPLCRRSAAAAAALLPLPLPLHTQRSAVRSMTRHGRGLMCYSCLVSMACDWGTGTGSLHRRMCIPHLSPAVRRKEH